MERLTCAAHLPVSCTADILEHRSYVSTLLKSTVSNGESNSALIIGPRGSGKTSVIKVKHFCLVQLLTHTYTTIYSL